MLNDFYKVGQVIEVKGQKIRVKVFENKNSTILIHNGQIIKNVSVGSYVKIPKGFCSVIGKIEGEYIQEAFSTQGDIRFTKESETIDRIIEISILGILEDDKFKRGLIEIPLVFSDVFVLTDTEVRKIFEFSVNIENAISIGSINDYKEQKLYVDIQKLFASHIGVFGNTGSGKSNTLAKIYTECFNRFKSQAGLKKSKFIFIDFNGEYENSFSEDKEVYKLSTRIDTGDKILINKSFLEDTDIWSIICEATEKTQRPFINRTISLYKRLHEKQCTDGSEACINYIQGMLKNLVNSYFEHPNLFVKHIGLLKSIFELLFYNFNSAFEILDNVYIYSQPGQKVTLRRKDDSAYSDTKEQFEQNITNPIITSLFTADNTRSFDEYVIFEFAIKFKYLDELTRQYINEEHIAPLIARFENRSKKMKKLFSICTEIPKRTISVFSLVDVNIQFKKIVPLIICKHFYDRHKENTAQKSLHIIIDEAHNILSTVSERESQTWKDYRLETFEEIIKEGRKFGVFLTIASQRPSDISETIISQLHNYFIHRLVNNEDIRAIGKAVAFIDNTSYEMISVLPQGACIFTGIASNFPILVQVDQLDKHLQPNSKTIDLIKVWSSNQ